MAGWVWLYSGIHCGVSLQSYFVEELTRENVDHLPKGITNEYSAKERLVSISV